MEPARGAHRWDSSREQPRCEPGARARGRARESRRPPRPAAREPDARHTTAGTAPGHADGSPRSGRTPGRPVATLGRSSRPPLHAASPRRPRRRPPKAYRRRAVREANRAARETTGKPQTGAFRHTARRSLAPPRPGDDGQADGATRRPCIRCRRRLRRESGQSVDSCECVSLPGLQHGRGDRARAAADAASVSASSTAAACAPCGARTSCARPRADRG